MGDLRERKTFLVGVKPRHRPFKRSLPSLKASQRARILRLASLAQDDKALGESGKFPCVWRRVTLTYILALNATSVAWLSGRASPSHGGGHRFKSCSDHQNLRAARGRPFSCAHPWHLRALWLKCSVVHGPIAQWRSRGLIILGLQVRVLLGPPRRFSRGCWSAPFQRREDTP